MHILKVTRIKNDFWIVDELGLGVNIIKYINYNLNCT